MKIWERYRTSIENSKISLTGYQPYVRKQKIVLPTLSLAKTWLLSPVPRKKPVTGGGVLGHSQGHALGIHDMERKIQVLHTVRSTYRNLSVLLHIKVSLIYSSTIPTGQYIYAQCPDHQQSCGLRHRRSTMDSHKTLLLN